VIAVLVILVAALAAIVVVLSSRRRSQRRAAEAQSARAREARKKQLSTVSANLRGVTDTQSIEARRGSEAQARAEERAP